MRMSGGLTLSKRGRWLRFAECVHPDDDVDPPQEIPPTPEYRHETLAQLAERTPPPPPPPAIVPLSIRECHDVRGALIDAGIRPLPPVMWIRNCSRDGTNPIVEWLDHIAKHTAYTVIH